MSLDQIGWAAFRAIGLTLMVIVLIVAILMGLTVIKLLWSAL